MQAALLAGACSAVQGLRPHQHGGHGLGGQWTHMRAAVCVAACLQPPPPLPPLNVPAWMRCMCPPPCLPCTAVVAATARPALRPQQPQAGARRRAAVRASAAAPSLDGILAGLLELPPQELEKAVEEAFLVSSQSSVARCLAHAVEPACGQCGVPAGPAGLGCAVAQAGPQFSSRHSALHLRTLFGGRWRRRACWSRSATCRRARS